MITALLFCGGGIALIVGAEALVRGASRLAFSFGVSPLVIGLTVVAFGTSAPETTVSVGAVLSGRTDIAVGNVVGSNILNILLILGISALITPMIVNAQIIRQEVPILLGATLLLVVFALDGAVVLHEASLLFFLLIAYTIFLLRQSRSQTAETKAEYAAEITPPTVGGWDAHWGVQLLLVFGGLALLVLGSDWIVTASVTFARLLGVSDVIVGLTIVAAGTSLPEVAASVAAAVRGERDIAVGNVVGSNLFNIFGCVGLSGIVAALAPGASGALTITPSIVAFDMWVMLATALACLPVFFTGREIARWEGGVFLGYYVAYVSYLILDATGHDQLENYSNIMLSFVVPLTIITLAVATFGRSRQDMAHSGD